MNTFPMLEALQRHQEVFTSVFVWSYRGATHNVMVLAFLIILVVAVICTVQGWYLWVGSFRKPANWQETVGFVSLVGCSVQFIWFWLYEIIPIVTGVSEPKIKFLNLWGVVNLCVLVPVIVTAIVGKGRFRILAAFSAMATTAAWILLGTAL